MLCMYIGMAHTQTKHCTISVGKPGLVFLANLLGGLDVGPQWLICPARIICSDPGLSQRGSSRPFMDMRSQGPEITQMSMVIISKAVPKPN